MQQIQEECYYNPGVQILEDALKTERSKSRSVILEQQSRGIGSVKLSKLTSATEAEVIKLVKQL